MPRPKPSTNPASTAATTETLNDHPTSPSSVSTLPPSPLSALTAITLNTPNQYLPDSTLSLPIGTTLNISRKNGSSRIGQSILGQLLAGNRSERDHQRLASDVTLSQETIRPKDQQRRSILPTNWTFSKSTTIQGLTRTMLSSGGRKVASGAIPASSQNMKETESNEHQHPMLPSVWLENVLSRLSRSDLKASHYATLPRVGIAEHKSTLRTMFTDPREQRDETTLAPRIKSMSSNPALNQKSKDALPLLEPKVVSRKASLSDEARALFQQNRPKTLSTAAVISSSIVSAEGSLGAPRQRSMDSSALKTTPSFPTNLPTNLPKSSIETCPSPTTTTRTTRGRFTIESSSGGSVPSRTRTLSCAGTTSPTISLHHSISTCERPMLSLSPATPTLPFSLPQSPSMPLCGGSTFSSSPPPSPTLSPSSTKIDTTSVDETSNSTSNPISIPRGKLNHQRTHSNSSVHSSTSTSSRRSQVIIPPPASTTSFQFVSFSSIAPTGGPGMSLAKASSASQQPFPFQQHQLPRRTASNYRNLSIQIVTADEKMDGSSDSRGSQTLHLDTPGIHPLDEDTSGQGSGVQRTHQTMNRVHPNHDLIESPGDCSTPLTACSTSCSSVSSMSSSLGNPNGASGSGYFRQRSLSATNFTPHRSPSQSHHLLRSDPLYMNQQQQPHQQHHHHLQLQPQQPQPQQPQPQQPQPQTPPGPWAERATRRTHGSISSAEHRSRSSTPVKGLSENVLGSVAGSSYSSSCGSSHGETNDVVVVKKSATGRMFTVERSIPASPTKCSRFIMVSSTDELPTPSPPRPTSPLQK